MNDLAEKALNGLDVARRQVCDRPMLSLSAAGFVVSCFVVAAGGLVSASRHTRPLTSWLGLLDDHGLTANAVLPGALLLAGIVALLLLWLLAVEAVRRTAPPPQRVWWLAAAWTAPFALGPPLMETTVYRYAAYGLLQRQGHNPYTHGPAALGSRAIVAAIEPGVRDTPSSAGPLGTVIQHLAASATGGSPLGAVIVLRVVAVLALVAIGRLATELAGAASARALSMTVLNPLVLLYVVSAAHLDAVMAAFVLAALVAATQRRWLWSLVLAGIAGSITGQGFLIVPAIVAVQWLGRRRVPTWRLLGRDVAVVAITTVAAALVVGDGFGWISTVSKQFSAHTPFSVAGGIAKVLTPIVRGASYDDFAAGARITTLTALVCTVVYLIATARLRSVERTAGYSLLALAFLSPVLYPWYLLWGLLCLAPTATGTRRIVLIALSAAGCLLLQPGFTSTTGNVVTGAALIAVAAATATVLHRRRPAAASTSG